MADLSKSLDEMIKEQKKDRKPKGGKGPKPSAGKGAKGGRGGGRIAGAKRGAAAPARAVKATPFQATSGGRGGGGKGAKGQAQAQGGALNKVFISGLPYDWEEHDILHVLETCGAVEKLTIFWDQKGRPTGNALAAYERNGSAKKAVGDLDGAKLGDKVIQVRVARGEKDGAGPVKAPVRALMAAAKGGKGAGKKEFQSTKKAGKGAKAAKGGNGSKGGGKGTKAKVERKEVNKDSLDEALDAYLKTE